MSLFGGKEERLAFYQAENLIILLHLQRATLDEDQFMREDDSGGVCALSARDEESGILGTDGAKSAQTKHGKQPVLSWLRSDLC